MAFCSSRKLFFHFCFRLAVVYLLLLFFTFVREEQEQSGPSVRSHFFFVFAEEDSPTLHSSSSSSGSEENEYLHTKHELHSFIDWFFSSFIRKICFSSNENYNTTASLSSDGIAKQTKKFLEEVHGQDDSSTRLNFSPYFSSSSFSAVFSSCSSSPSSIIFPSPITDPVGVSRWYANFKRYVLEKVDVFYKEKNTQNTLPLSVPSSSSPLLSLKNKIEKAIVAKFCQEEIEDSRPASSKTYAEFLNKNLNVGNKEEEKEKNVISTEEEKKAPWVAEVSPRFMYLSIKEAKKMMGTFVGEKMIKLPPKQENENNKKDIPEMFDARTHFDKCKDVIGHIRDQATCGSCWAFASTEAFNDRLCIASGGEFSHLLSVQDTTSCCNFVHCMSLGCNGGHPGLAWKWFTRAGTVTGGDYDDLGVGDTCWPYELPFCSHHADSPFPKCDGGIFAKTPQCRKKCEEKKYENIFKADKHKASSAYGLRGEGAIKTDIMENGPVTAAFMVFEDFFNYKGGIYSHKHGRPVGGHAVKIVGWGEEEGVKYWIVLNSWNSYWGDGGSFKIKMHEGGIDGSVCAGSVEWRGGGQKTKGEESEGVVYFE